MKSFFIDTIIRPKSNICFPADEIVHIDGGKKKCIQHIQPLLDTIDGHVIRKLTMSYSTEKTLTMIKKNSFGNDIPNKDTLISNHHKIHWKDKRIEAKHFVGVIEGIEHVPYDYQLMYNILLDEEGEMVINNMVVETLHPDNNVAKLFHLLATIPHPERAIELFNREKKNQS